MYVYEGTAAGQVPRRGSRVVVSWIIGENLRRSIVCALEVLFADKVSGCFQLGFDERRHGSG
jgi:hypothetical protein